MFAMRSRFELPKRKRLRRDYEETANKQRLLIYLFVGNAQLEGKLITIARLVDGSKMMRN